MYIQTTGLYEVGRQRAGTSSRQAQAGSAVVCFAFLLFVLLLPTGDTWVHGQHAKGPASAGPQERLGRSPSPRRASAPCPGTNAHAPETSTGGRGGPEEGRAVSPGKGGREAGPLQSPTHRAKAAITSLAGYTGSRDGRSQPDTTLLTVACTRRRLKSKCGSTQWDAGRGIERSAGSRS